MRTNRPLPNVIVSGSMFVSPRRGIPFLPGLMLIALGVVVLLAPRLVLGAIAFFLLVLGGLLCYVAYKIIALRRQIATLAKTFEGSVYGTVRGAGGEETQYSDKPDIDITDFENSKKIVYH